MEGPEMVIELTEDAIPFYVNGSRPLPFADHPAVKKLLDDYVEKGIMIPHQFVRRPTHPTPAPRDAVAEITGDAKFFSTFDAANGYYQITLTCVATSHRFYDTVGQVQISACTNGPMQLQRRVQPACRSSLRERQQHRSGGGDLLRFDKSFPEHVAGVYAVLSAARKSGITFSLKKFQFARTQLQWVGFQIQPGGVSVDPEKIRATSDFPKPTNITELRSFMGLVEQLAGFSTDVAATKEPLRPLLSSRNSFV
jgi:hypothetical protein